MAAANVPDCGDSPSKLCGLDAGDENSLPPFATVFQGLHEHLQLPPLSQDSQTDPPFCSQDIPPPPPLSLNNSPQVLTFNKTPQAVVFEQNASASKSLRKTVLMHSMNCMQDEHKFVRASSTETREKTTKACVSSQTKKTAAKGVPVSKKRRMNFHEWQVDLLKRCFETDTYFASTDGVEVLAQKCMLTVEQVRQWFENTRKRTGQTKTHRRTRERLREMREAAISAKSGQ